MGKRKNRNSLNGGTKTVEKMNTASDSPVHKKIKHNNGSVVKNKNGNKNKLSSKAVHLAKNKSDKKKENLEKSSLNSEYCDEKFVTRINQSWKKANSEKSKLTVEPSLESDK